MDNVQNCDSYINIQSPQTYRSYLHITQLFTIDTRSIVRIIHFVCFSRRATVAYSLGYLLLSRGETENELRKMWEG
jgi:hypothetical protein